MTLHHIEFNVIREDFNEYETENSQILRVKYVILDVVERFDLGKIDIRVNPVSLVITPVNIDTTKMEYANPDEVSEKDQIKDLLYKPLKEGINIYETARTIILVSLHMEKVSLTNKKDKEGSPILRFKSAAFVNIVEKPAVKT